MKLGLKFFLINIILISFPGCSRYINLAKKTFKQAEKTQSDISQAIKFVRSENLYDQFTTIGLFDVLWVSPKVQEVYKNLKHIRLGALSEEDKEELNLELEKNNKFVTFYLLLPPLGAKDFIDSPFDFTTEWQVYLDIDGAKYSPKEFSYLYELDPEYAFIFGKSYNKFRSIYIARFEAEKSNKNIINNNSKNLKLTLSSLKYAVNFSWILNNS